MFNNQTINALADYNTVPNYAIDALCTPVFLVVVVGGGRND